MNDNNNNPIDAVLDSGIKKAAENILNNAAKTIVDFIKKKYNEHKVDIGTAFDRYLNNASLRYNQIRTLATGNEPRPIIGDNSIYVDIGIKYQEKIISTSTPDPVLEINRNILILGSGGVGKSMLMRHLFLKTAKRGDYIPILFELRRIKRRPQGQISILDQIYAYMKEYDVQLSIEQFEYSLRSGKYLFLFDGYDEVKEALSIKTAEAIQSFSFKYPQNPCIITSRPRYSIDPFDTFTVVELMPLTKEQSVLLASKIWPDDEKTKQFCKELKETLFDQHKDFAENPLLLSMMYLTFMRNNSIPEHLSDFYQKSYEALYGAHDNYDKGYYKRDFKCKNLDESKFKLLFSRFCFQTYLSEIYDFSEKVILSYLDKSILKLGLKDVIAKDYLADLRNIVCMIIKAGDIYIFSHRSFQAYFAAYYTSYVLTDEQQKKLFLSLLSNKDTYINKNDYYNLLTQIEPERFAVNALEDGLRTIQDETDADLNPDIFFLQKQYSSISVANAGTTKEVYYRVKEEHLYYFNIIGLFRAYIAKIYSMPINKDSLHDIETIKNYIIKLSDSDNQSDSTVHDCIPKLKLSFEDMDNSDCVTEDEKRDFYSAINRIQFTSETRNAIHKWLLKIDEKRQHIKSTDFFDEL